MIENNINITLPSPYEAQKKIIRACLNKEDKFIVLNASRQSGKTLSACIVAIYWALQQGGQHIMIVSPTDSQVKKIYKQIIQMLEPVIKHVVKSYKIQAGDSEIVFNNKSAILFRSAASENSLRGYSNTHLILDECAFIKEETWNTILGPTLIVKGKKVFFCSTPKGSNYFQKLFYKGLDGEPGYKSFKITYDENPYANLEFIEGQRETLPIDIFEQEYLGMFVDSTGVFKNIDQISTGLKQTPKGQKCVIGIDIAFVNDYSVAVCLDSSGVMLDYLRFNKSTTSEMVKLLSDFVKKWGAHKTVIESNNQGLPIISLLKEAGVYGIEPFNTSSSSKSDIINALMVACAKKEIVLLNDEKVKEEMKAFTYSIGKTGNITFAASYGTDDIVMSLAFAYKGVQSMKAGTFMIY
jgi:hypothetical protein